MTDEPADTGERFNFALQLHAKLSRGGSMYVYRCEEYGITRSCGRSFGNVPWECHYTADAIEGQQFDTLREVVSAIKRVRGIE